MNLFPLFLDLADKTVLIVGGGKVAARKLEKLRPFTDNLVVVAKETDLSLTDGPAKDIAALDVRPFEETDLARADLVIAATDDRALNRRIAGLCREAGKPVDVVSDPELCTFFFPSLVRRGDLVVGITTGGKAPAFGQEVRRLLEAELPDDTEEIIDALYAYKQELKQTVPDRDERAKLVKAFLLERLSPDEEEEAP